LLSGDFVNGFKKLLLVLQNQAPVSPSEKVVISPKPFDPTATKTINNILADFDKLASSITVSKDTNGVSQQTKDTLTKFLTGITAGINLLRVSKVDDIQNNQKVFQSFAKQLEDTMKKAGKPLSLEMRLGLSYIGSIHDSSSQTRKLKLIDELLKKN
jgi:hypothetical protein